MIELNNDKSSMYIHTYICTYIQKSSLIIHEVFPISFVCQNKSQL